MQQIAPLPEVFHPRGYCASWQQQLYKNLSLSNAQSHTQQFEMQVWELNANSLFK